MERVFLFTSLLLGHAFFSRRPPDRSQDRVSQMRCILGMALLMEAGGLIALSRFFFCSEREGRQGFELANSCKDTRFLHGVPPTLGNHNRFFVEWDSEVIRTSR